MSRPRKGNKGAKGKGIQKGKETMKKEGSTALRAFQPFASGTAQGEDAPWLASTPTSRLPRVNKSGKKEPAEEAEQQEEEANESLDQAKALLANGSIPDELKQALTKFTTKESEVTHSDVSKLKRLKIAFAKQKDGLKALETQWEDFVQLSKSNWEYQRENFLQMRAEQVKILKATQEKMLQLQKEISDKATLEEEQEEEKFTENEEYTEEGPIPPWDIEIPDEDLDMEPVTPAASKAMHPFGKPPPTKKPKTAA